MTPENSHESDCHGDAELQGSSRHLTILAERALNGPVYPKCPMSVGDQRFVHCQYWTSPGEPWSLDEAAYRDGYTTNQTNEPSEHGNDGEYDEVQLQPYSAPA